PRALSKSKMPPQQPDRLLDLVDDILDFRAHHDPAGVRDASPPAGCSDCARSTQWAPMRGHAGLRRARLEGADDESPLRKAQIALQAKPVFFSLPQFFS